VAPAASRGEDRTRRGTAAAGLDGAGSVPQAGLVTGRAVAAGSSNDGLKAASVGSMYPAA
jgi:hypothetical protein